MLIKIIAASLVSLIAVFDTSYGFLYNHDFDNITVGNHFMFGRNGFQPINYGVQPPLAFDWRDKDMVSPVKNQGQCNACWAFSVAANIESQLAIYLNEKEQLSEQFLLDCIIGNPGCGPYSMLKAFSYITSVIGGVLRINDYSPYVGRPGRCTYNMPPPYPMQVMGFRRVANDENRMVMDLYAYGPLSAAINPATMMVYKGNYIDEPTEQQCSSNPAQMSHAVLIVGYNVYTGPGFYGRTVPYWIIKNSWGDQWGDNGFYYLVRGRNACGIANDVSLALIN